MREKIALVVTTISRPNEVLLRLAKDCKKNGIRMIVIGDRKSPSDFHIDDVDYYSIDEQRNLDFKFVEICPYNHYSRKNIGYLIAIKNGAKIIIETDDDNMPKRSFWSKRLMKNNVKSIDTKGWYNIYSIYIYNIL